VRGADTTLAEGYHEGLQVFGQFLADPVCIETELFEAVLVRWA
jgi:hypothetical protein